MKRSFVILFLLVTGSVFAGNRQGEKTEVCEYVVIASRLVGQDKAWREVVETLQSRHAAKVVYYTDQPAETLETLQRVRPRYVAVVEKPERVTRDYIIGMHVLSRKVTPSIYADFIWGIITGFDADMAMKMVNNAKEPLEIERGLIVQRHAELKDAGWEQMGYIGVGNSGLKTRREDTLAVERWETAKQVEMFERHYRKLNPEFVLFESRVPAYHLSMPDNASVPERIYARDGAFRYVKEEVKIEDNRVSRRDISDKELDWSGGRKVYIAAGTCGCDVEQPGKSCALAWMGTPNVTSMVGYPTAQVWLGQAVWGGLKFWHVTPGRYTMAESYFLGQQHILHTLRCFSPGLLEASYNTNWDTMKDWNTILAKMEEVTGKEISSRDVIGFWQERDLLAYFGDPKWDVRFRPGEETYTVKTARKGKKYIITLTTKENFQADHLEGTYMRVFDNEIPGLPATVGKIPFAVIFPERLNNPRWVSKQDWDVALSDDMLLVYDAWFEPGKTYKLVLRED